MTDAAERTCAGLLTHCPVKLRKEGGQYGSPFTYSYDVQGQDQAAQRNATKSFQQILEAYEHLKKRHQAKPVSAQQAKQPRTSSKVKKSRRPVVSPKSFMMDLQQYIKDLNTRKDLHVVLRHHDPAVTPAYATLDPPLPPGVGARIGNTPLYTHQKAVIDLVRARNNVIIVTPTSSGKSYGYGVHPSSWTDYPQS